MKIISLSSLSRCLAFLSRSVFFVWMVATVACAQTNLSGFWVFRVPTGDGNFRETFFELQQNGGTLTGKMLAGARELAIAEGTYEGGAVHFTVAFGTPPQTT